MSLNTILHLLGNSLTAKLSLFSISSVIKQEWNAAYRQGFVNNLLYQLDAGSQDGMTNGGTFQEYGLRSFFGE